MEHGLERWTGAWSVAEARTNVDVDADGCGGEANPSSSSLDVDINQPDQTRRLTSVELALLRKQAPKAGHARGVHCITTVCLYLYLHLYPKVQYSTVQLAQDRGRVLYNIQHRTQFVHPTYPVAE